MYRKNKKKKKKRKEKKVREEQNVSSRRELPTIRFLSRLFFVCHASLFSLGGWILLIVTGESWVKIVRGGWKKKKEGKTMVVKRSVVISETLDFTRGGERIAFSSTINKRRLESIVGYFSTTKETAISMRQTRRNWSPLSLQIYRFFFWNKFRVWKLGIVFSLLFFFSSFLINNATRVSQRVF